MLPQLILFPFIGAVIMLIGFLVYKYKAFKFIAGHEIWEWRGVDKNQFLKIFRKGTMGIGIGVLFIPDLLLLYGYEKYSGFSIIFIMLAGAIYVTLTAIRLPVKP